MQQLRRPFFDLLSGKIDIITIANKTGKPEFLYWKYLFCEAWHCFGLEPNSLYPFLNKTQPSFDINITQRQIKTSNGPKGKPISDEELSEMFPSYIAASYGPVIRGIDVNTKKLREETILWGPNYSIVIPEWVWLMGWWEITNDKKWEGRTV